MTWLDGAPLMGFRDADTETRNRIARNLFRAWYVPFYRSGTIHGDPHLGHYGIRPDPSLNLFDFASIRVFPRRFVRGVIDPSKALRAGDPDRNRTSVG